MKSGDDVLTTEFARRGAAVAAFAALVTLTGCGPATNSAAPAQGSASNAATAGATGAQAAAPALPPMPDPDKDSRPDRVKFDDFAAHLERQQSDLAAADASFLTAVRTAMQSGAQGAGKLVLAGYRGQIVAAIAALPAPPRLTGCFARAAAPGARAEAAVAAMLSDRRDKADAVAAIADRPLTLPDFGGLATDIATGAGVADAKDSLAAARAAVAGCRDAPVGAPTARERGGSAEETGPASEPSAEAAPASGKATAPAAPQAAPSQTAPPPKAPKKPSLFERIFGGG